jgi:hypothetical protein
MRRFSWIGICAALALICVFPATVFAKSGHRVRPAGTEAFIELEAGDYDFFVEANDQQHVLLAAQQELFTTTEYSTEGRVSSKRIDADFGDLGHIDIKLRLFPGRSQRYPPGRNCHGRGSIFIPGSFHGTIEFSGEGDVPPVTTTHGEIGFIRRFRRVCKSEQPPSSHDHRKKRKPKLDVGYLAASGKGEGRTVILEAINFASKQRPARSFGLLFAGDYERREEVRIERTTLEFFGAESFRVSKSGMKPETVKVKLPEPFAGRALYLHSPGSPPSWTGNLRVNLPGAADVPLAGPTFDAAFCRGSSLGKAERCLEAAQGSGSHSQPLALAKLSSLRYLRNSSSSAGSTLYTWSGSGKWRLRTSAP